MAASNNNQAKTNPQVDNDVDMDSALTPTPPKTIAKQSKSKSKKKARGNKKTATKKVGGGQVMKRKKARRNERKALNNELKSMTSILESMEFSGKKDTDAGAQALAQDSEAIETDLAAPHIAPTASHKKSTAPLSTYLSLPVKPLKPLPFKPSATVSASMNPANTTTFDLRNFRDETNKSTSTQAASSQVNQDLDFSVASLQKPDREELRRGIQQTFTTGVLPHNLALADMAGLMCLDTLESLMTVVKEKAQDEGMTWMGLDVEKQFANKILKKETLMGEESPKQRRERIRKKRSLYRKERKEKERKLKTKGAMGGTFAFPKNMVDMSAGEKGYTGKKIVTSAAKKNHNMEIEG